MEKYSSIWEGKSIWDEDSSDWVSNLLSQAEQEAEEMEQQQAQEEEDDDAFMNELLEDEEAQDSDTIVRSASQNLDGIYSPSSSNSGGSKNIPQGGSIAVSHNNPGNIKFGEFAKKYGATEGRRATDGGVFAQFPDVETGLKAKQDLLLGSGYRNLTVDQAMRRWSNNGYGGELYPEIANRKISDLSDEELSALSQKQIKREDGAMARKMGIKQYGGYQNIREENGKWIGDEIDANGIPHTVMVNPAYINSYGFQKNKFDFHLPSNYGMMSQPPIQLPEVEIKGKRNSNASQEDPTILSPIRDIFGAIVDEQSKVEDKKFLSNIPSDLYGMFQDVRTFAKNKANTAIDAINTGLDTTISYLGDQQNNENIAKANKWLADERYTPVRNSRNKKRAYI